MKALSKASRIHGIPSLCWLVPALLTAAGLLACSDSRTDVCLNGVRCPVGLMCVEPHSYCAPPEAVVPCLGKAENERCSYDGFNLGICRLGVCELDDCEDSVDCNDGNPCTRDSCIGDRCQRDPLDGASCDDGNFCNGGDTCMAGACSEHSGDPCKRGNTYCDIEQNACAGCTADSECPDGTPGSWGSCAGEGDVCSRDGSQTRPMITFTCDSESICRPREGTETRACTRSTDGLSCNDGDLCTTNDQCTAGLCDGPAMLCDDGKQCTVGSCTPESGCRHNPLPFGSVCGYGRCDGMGDCITCTNVGQACSTSNLCERGEIRCMGGEPTCVAVGLVPAGTECRAAAGGCDVAETCTGNSPSCPDDTLQNPGVACRASAGACDVAETCTGTSATCPADVFLSPTTTCRASAGVCDIAETCTGATAACPADAFRSPATTCRGSAGACDMAETCTGTGPSCPGDALQPPGTVCRSPANGCDIAEQCNGSSAFCPADNPGCAFDEYCHINQCVDLPTIDAQGSEGDACFDMGIAHPFPGGAPRVVFRGRPGAAFPYYRQHVSCASSFFVQDPNIDCAETGPGDDTVLPAGGTCTEVYPHDAPFTDCPLTNGGHWEVFFKVDGHESNHDVVSFYNSTASCPSDPLPQTCNAARFFCPCTGACNGATCPSPGMCPSVLTISDTWDFENAATGSLPVADMLFSTAEDTE